MTQQSVQFDELERLQSFVGNEFGSWGEKLEVTQDMIWQFADLSGDHQWIHVDPERARTEGPFGAPVAHGMLVMSILPRIMPQNPWRITGHGAALNYGSDGLRFMAPVLAGMTVHARTRLAAAVRHAKGSLVTTETAVHVVDQARPALLYRAQLLYIPRAA